MGYGKKSMGGAHPILKHMRPTGGGTGTKQSMSKNADIKYGGPVIDKFKSPMNVGVAGTIAAAKAAKSVIKKGVSWAKDNIRTNGLSYNEKQKLKNTKIFSKKKK